MAKLNVKVSMVVDTGPLVVRNNTKFHNENVKGKKLESMLAGADPDKIGFEVAAADDNIFITFVFNRPSGKRGSVIEVTAKPDKSGLTGRIEGQFEVKLRAGVPVSKDMDLRLTSITLNDGYWSGFSAYPVGIDGLELMDSFFSSLPKITEFVVK